MRAFRASRNGRRFLTSPLPEQDLTVFGISCKVFITHSAREVAVLAYLESLCRALKARDSLLIGGLLRHPLASALPPQVLEEAERIAATAANELSVPIHALKLYHQTAHLLGACTDPATRRRPSATVAPRSPGERTRQMELELPTRAAVA
jgi:hypothetical protein